MITRRAVKWTSPGKRKPERAHRIGPYNWLYLNKMKCLHTLFMLYFEYISSEFLLISQECHFLNRVRTTRQAWMLRTFLFMYFYYYLVQYTHWCYVSINIFVSLLDSDTYFDFPKPRRKKMHFIIQAGFSFRLFIHLCVSKDWREKRVFLLKKCSACNIIGGNANALMYMR